MKSFLLARYHLILLGAAVIAALASAAYLMLQSRDFEDSFKNSPLTAKPASYTPPSTTTSATASEYLKKSLNWKERKDGASPYISRQYLLKDGKLVDVDEENEPPLHPPVPNKWITKNLGTLALADINILERDPKHKGFTVKEEFEAGTDPNDSKQIPPLALKLSIDENSIEKTTYSFEFLGLKENDAGVKELQLRLLTPLPNPEKGGKLDTSTRGLVKGKSIPGEPSFLVEDFQEKKKFIDETEYDVSELTLLNALSGERYILTQKNESKEYKKKQTPIEIVKKVTFAYQLTGGTPQSIVAELGKKFQVSYTNSIGNDGNPYSETYEIKNLSKDGVLLKRDDGKIFPIKPNSQVVPSSLPTSSNTP